MSFSFRNQSTKASLENTQQVKELIYRLWNLDADTVISLSQLNCHKSDCPPVETVITVMTNPIQSYKIHKAISDINEEDILCLNNI
ncbi:hypothetical protein [Calothrix sp. 336/3]|uniref:hypothetical protein n=1 Tax=Calothrix sp. 336/3 TaxID=1337936 RepID=UPI0004E3F379|nr:hypothetical protein [Calothrix sp. 336/3]AKG22121.1 hypothetical protein IJ00_13395 [Calothrix sp. 336/3]